MRSRRRFRSRALGSILAGLIMVATGVPAMVTATSTPAYALGNGLALTPPMGFNDWNAFGCNVSEQLIEQTALAMHTNGLQAAGYKYVNIDDCWMAPQRDANGNLVADPVKFPDGIKAVADYVHSLGLKLGIYEDAGNATCAGFPGSYGHEPQDAATFASWGVDYLKYDWCNVPFGDFPGQTHQEVAQVLYTRMRDALAATGRPIVFSMCNGWDPSVQPWTWAGPVSNLWRTTGDIAPTFGSMLNNFTINSAIGQNAGPGSWNDPDMLEIGNGMTATEDQTEFSLWSEMAAPLIAGTDLRPPQPVSWVPGVLGNALYLNGGGQYVSLPSGIVSGLHDFTISAWVKPTVVSTWSRVFDFGTGTRINMFLTISQGTAPRFAITTNGSGAEQRLTGTSPLPAGQWTHLTVTLSGTTGTLYVNGTPVATNTGMTLNPASLGATGRNYIGKSQYSDPYLNAAVDDFQIYGRALSSAEVQALAGGAQGAGDVADYRFDSVSGTTAVDSSGNGRDGTINAGGLSAASLATLTNTDVIAVDQDPMGAQGSVVASDGSQWTLNKPLANGDKAVVLFNAGSSAAPMSASFASLGLDPGRPYILRDLWQHQYMAGQGTLNADVASHGTVMYRIIPDTFAALKQVVASYSTDPDVTAGLNDKLTAAAAAPDTTALNQQIDAFDHQVSAQTGKALTQAQGAALTELADALR